MAFRHRLNVLIHQSVLHDTSSSHLHGQYLPLPRCRDRFRENEAPRIPDPYYGGDQGFAHVIDLLEDGCAVLLEELSKKE